ncbi:DUF3592 domain-containing protein [Sulfurimonas sp.]|uniref:DUF3592 domain-containing protein n=1 Tax=Sulfurimonas sp. TaxID=2022749 RepID=UPI003D0FAD0F
MIYEDDKLEIVYDKKSFWIFFSSILVACSVIIPESYLVAFVVGIVNINIFAYYFYLDSKSKNWVLIEGNYSTYQFKKFKINNFSRNSTKVVQTYCEYTYTVEGEKYFSNVLSIVNKDYYFHETFLELAKELVRKNPKTKTLQLYYNPKNPSESILVKGLSNSYILQVYIIGIIGMIAFLVSTYDLVK